ncbi:hypothetical protein M6D81_31015 [Paenibacillus sp. J5C_2022]|uniref:hypothetical protein n=1 Tax=Paenibacillus sp. J5C2022 TaxID=2977129 RepID=UPI0021D03548|nr:hypothetical protein [Paenibacillus sp. J5C2022]MCU6713140.1 hypothetical protein [Paenibacillus sp. J5C2022]
MPMLLQLNEQLALLRGNERQKLNWESRLNQLSEELKRRTRERDEWEQQLKKEQRDVEKLKGLSLGSFFYTLIGKKEEKLTVEEEEALQAKLKYDEAADTVQEIADEMNELRQRLLPLAFIQNDIQILLNEKNEVIMASYPELAAELRQVSDEEAVAGADAKELKEAVSAGRAVLGALDQAKEKLSSAQNWGTYDMLGGGMISTAIKHDRIDSAKSAIHNAQNRLRRFQAELKDVERDVHVTIDIGSMLTFADYFFDGFITDWVVQGRINESLRQVEDKRHQIHRIVSQLSKELAACEAKRNELLRRQSSIIENA